MKLVKRGSGIDMMTIILSKFGLCSRYAARVETDIDNWTEVRWFWRQ